MLSDLASGCEVYLVTGYTDMRKGINGLATIVQGKPRPFPFKNIKGVYKLRGKNREKALKDGLAVEYDRLAVFAVSVFHLSHWRLDSLTNYLLAV